MRRKFLALLTIVLVAIVASAMGARYFLLAPLYVAEFRRHPELFVSHTKVLHILFEDGAGGRLGNLTGLFEVRRDGYTVYLNISYFFTCDPSIENLAFDSGVVWLVTKGPEPVPIPTTMPERLTLRDGKSKIFYIGVDEFNWDWEYAQITILSDIGDFQIQFSDGQMWKTGEKYYFYNMGEDLFAFLYLNKTEVETETVQIKTV